MSKNDSNSLEHGPGKKIQLTSDAARQELDFSGYHWWMERMRVGQGVEEGIHKLPNEHSGNDYSWNIANVPGDVYTDLYNAGEIDDPHFGRNMGRAKWAGDYEWWYTHSFHLPETMRGKNLTLVFEGVDYSCDVWFNTKYMGRHEGMMSSFSFDVTDIIDEETPHTPPNKILLKLDPPPKNQINFAGMKHNFAGDYLTGLIPFGIWKPVKLIATEKVRIDNYRMETTLTGDDATIDFDIDLTKFDGCSDNLSVQYTLSDGEKEHVMKDDISLINGATQFKSSMTIEKPQLWWPYELGEPFLYDLEIIVFDGDTPLDSKNEKVGIREITMAMNPGYTKEESEIPWTFVVNGKPMFLRSACWGGQPSFFYGRNSEEKYRFYLEKAKECHINNLRIFGWHPAETEEFYQICDELGITVWTNFSFATQIFRDDEEYLNKVYKEVAEIVKDRRNHPSTVMWMGGEEVYFTEAHVKSNNRNLMEAIGAITKELTNVPYADASPLSSREGVRMGYKPKESVHANSHYYASGAVLMEDYYPNIDACIIPELTAASAPNITSLKKFIPEDELWPMGLSWGYHGGNIHVLQALNYEVFGDICMDSLEQWVDATQIAQGTVFQFSLEHFRRQKPHVSGVSLCHFITHWPLIKWEIIDYYGEEKKSFDFVKRAYQPLLASMQHDKRRYLPGETFTANFYVVNDYYTVYEDLTYRYEMKYQNGEVIKEGSFKATVGENSAECFQTVDWLVDGQVGENFTIDISLTDESGKVLSSNNYTLLIDDQEKAKVEAKKLYLARHAERAIYGKGYYRNMSECLDNKW